ncbi:MAG: hypothetical protein ACYC2K_10085 [Gemmatimonadales bacterium]
MKKNVASQKIGAQMIAAADGSAFTGSVTVAVTGDAGSQATGSVGSGACTHEGNGYHTYAPAQAETNYDLVAFTFTGTGAIPMTVQVFTEITPGTAGGAFIAGQNAATSIVASGNDNALTLVGSGTGYALAGESGATAAAAIFFDAVAASGVGALIRGGAGGMALAAVTDGSGLTLISTGTGVGLETDTITVSGAVTFTGGLVSDITGDITGTLSTVTNLTNAPTSGDLTATMKTSIGTAVAASAVASVTAPVTVGTNSDKTGYALSATGSAALTESYAADGAAATMPQLLYMIWAFLSEKNIASTTLTAKKLDGSTDAMTFTLDSASAPTTITRAS